jgi:hypothetical protein
MIKKKRNLRFYFFHLTNRISNFTYITHFGLELFREDRALLTSFFL